MNEINHSERAHSKIVGGSTAARVIKCPASVAEINALPEVDTNTPHTERGTALHEAMEFFLGSDDAPETIQELAGMVFNKHEIDEELLAEALVPAAHAFDHYATLAKHEGGLEFELETRVEVTQMPVEGVFGTCDIIGRTKRRTVIWDWKFGRTPVSARENTQGLFYGAGALCTMPEMFDAADDDWPVDIVICQPGGDFPAGAPCYDRWTTTVGRLLDFADELEAAIVEAMSATPKRARGSHCQFARCKVNCPLHVAPLERLANTMAQLAENRGALEALATPGVAESDLAAQQEIEVLQDDQATLYGKAMDLADMVEPWVKRVREEVHARLEAGFPVHGFKLVPKRASRTGWTDDDKAVRLMRRLKLKKEDMYTQKLLTPAQAEKALKAKEIIMDDKQAKEFASLSPATSSGSTVAPYDDKRKALDPTQNNVSALATALLGR